MVHAQGDPASAPAEAPVRLLEATIMSERRFCSHCGQPMPLSPADVVEARVAAWRVWCRENGRWVSPADDRVDENTAAELLGVSPFTMRNWRSARQPLRFVRVRGRVSYRLHDLALMIEEGQ